MAVIKTRTTDHERTIREFIIDSSGIRIGEPLFNFENILGGNPRFSASEQKLLEDL